MARPILMSEGEYRQHIVDAADKIVREGGVSQLSIRAIAKKAATSATQMYRKGIKGIEDIIFMLNERALDILIARIEKVNLTALSGEAALYEIAEIYLEFSDPIGEDYPLWELMQRLNTGSIESPQSYQEKTLILFNYGERALAKALPLLESNELTEATRVLWASVHGICHLHARDKLVSTGVSPAKPMIKLLIKVLLAGLSVSNSAEKP
ncbi:TetR/AcrR family transcriptional regulator [Piscirickettsia litoralis]|uniref:TetR family transcriptional regulator n=1 Tax=Piscirickettsia litoralis TaxID=1891921 RepID=A0ABX3A493_9GAMM|nr:TetR/AcrR family transcriptional regulator [Piscirickettsia litoralis]ODN42200.1 TetR family transcriptional regulator [Piscirickettsia litoralis]